MQTIRDILDKYLCKDNLSEYRFCEVTQIVLFSNEMAINYFTNIECSSKYDKPIAFHYITAKPMTIGECKSGKLKLAISSYTISVNDLINLISDTDATGLWRFNGKDVMVDDLFLSDIKYVPESDPTGGQYNVFVPLEYGIYGSNFMGNYYVFELFSRKTELDVMLSPVTIQKIQKELIKCGLPYRLDKMHDRIGNIVVKMPIEVLTVKPLKLGDYGIELEFSLQRNLGKNRYCLSVTQTHDGLIYTNRILNNFDCKAMKVSPNQYKTMISVVDTCTQLTLYYGCFDYSVYSNYFSQITPSNIIAQSPDKRIIHIDKNDVCIQLPNIKMGGLVNYFEDLEMASKRKISLDDDYYIKQGYLRSYSYNEHEVALRDIVEIMSNSLSWDLQEIWVVDPYLCPNDLAKTAFQCRVKGIVIKALCDYSAIHGNRYTNNDENNKSFEVFKEHKSTEMQHILGSSTDIQIDYRTIRNEHSFHDRYIIMKYQLNKERVWALGASINSLGKKHSIIQIVNAPQAVISQIDELWNTTNNSDCFIFSNLL